MKKNVLLILAVVCSGLFTNLKAENICYEATEASAVDFWFTHNYYGTCTDYAAANSKLAGETGRIDFNGGSSLVFNNIHVSKDGTYKMTLTYGIGWADATGAVLKLLVNDEFISNCTFYPIAPAETATMDISVDLVANYDNVITFTQQKDWPTISDIKLVKEQTAVSTPSESDNYTVYVADGAVHVKVLDNATNHVEIYSSLGQLIDSNYFNDSYSKKLDKGMYLVKVNGETNKVLVP